MKRSIYMPLFCLVLISTFLLVGCQKNDPRKKGLVPAGGTITYNGSPLAEATIVFTSKTNQQGAGALSGTDGKFELTTISNKDGVLPGEYTVFVQKELFENLSDEELLEHNRQGKPSAKPKSLIPDKYTNPANPIINITIPETGNKNILIELKD
ncbi:MAG: carboxypeptidase-like regulatory domain-containing protein [Planctomycetaceae bacterium]|nr:carboxypeptidase-like regulatory domain-containing protein [Planctomycetaceae bacterium]